MKLNVPVILFYSLLMCLPVSGCKASEGVLQQKYGADAAYFEGLRCLKNKNYSDACRYFTSAAQEGSPVIARRALKERAALEDVSARIKTYEEIYRRYKDKESRRELCEQYLKYRQPKKILDLTYGIKFEPEFSDDLYYRYEALSQCHEKIDGQSLYRWFVEFPFTERHKTFIEEHELEDEVLLFRKYVYERKYSRALNYVEKVMEGGTSPLLYSDIGKTLLYAAPDYRSAVKKLETAVIPLSDVDSCFYGWFYIGRLSSKTGDVNSAMAAFLQAMQFAQDKSKFDNALWYLLNESLKLPYTETINLIAVYAPHWHDSSYYDDFFETLSTNLLSKQLWKQYLEVTGIIDGFASQETCAKYFYVSGRLIEERYIPMSVAECKQQSEEYFKKAAGCRTNLYYLLLAGQKAGYSQKEMEEAVLDFGLKTSVKVNADAERLLEGYADYGFPEYIYDAWNKYSSEISMDCACKIALFLKQCGVNEERYCPQSLRIASRKMNYPEKKLTSQMLELAFPRNYSEEVTKCCEDFNQSEYLLYALIRSESFFDSSIQSHAGATGLTQLMDSTAGDVARKLKVKDYDLTDSSTNIRFGSFYLEELIHRIDESELRALFSYNAGITNVRKWIKTASILFGREDFSNDLFLEALPFAETREYGRKLVSAASLYGELYYGKTFAEVIRQIMN
ncbi:lytic transglycosylase domain-containing protein [Treponema rectale]|uniref:Lytic transglycosylase domain-containing protein n=1 Tax=Treponema rectale TaxID=744512 RepID=A0A840SG73_9SPIR|nr:soluble lytic murein transglycosylase [Treponema rectale]QOS40943.1 lytic transglycosylase domain-containing protein [Treponema rectale]